MDELDAKEVAMVLDHVEGCLCNHFCLRTIEAYSDAKLIDARCIARYLVPSRSATEAG